MIRSASFQKSVTGPDPIFEDGRPKVALAGRSNVGKSSTINALTRTRGLARKSATPGRTRELNLYLVNRSFYLVDLPGYGFSASSKGQTHRQEDLIGWYLFESPDPPAAVVLIIDGSVGATRADLETLDALERRGYEIIVAANKIDRIKPSVRERQLQALQESVGGHLLIPYSAEKNVGVTKLAGAILRFV